MNNIKDFIKGSKTDFCNHDKSCAQNCLVGAFQAFGKAFLAKLCLNALFTLLKLKKILQGKKIFMELFSSLINKSNFSIGAFMGIQTFLLKGIQCLMRIMRKKEDGWNALVSGAISGGISYLTLDQRVRYIVRVYMFGRAVDCIYQSHLQDGPWRNNYLIPQIIFTITSGIVAYGYFFEPDIVPTDTLKVYDNFAHQSLNDRIWHMCNIQGFRNRTKFNT